MLNTKCLCKKITSGIMAVSIMTMASGVYAEDAQKTIKLDNKQKLRTVNGKDIRVLDWNVEFSTLSPEAQQQGKDALFLPVLDSLVQKSAIADKAVSEGYAKGEEYNAYMAKAKRDLLTQMYIDKKIDAVLSKTDMKKEYDDLKKSWKGQKEIKSSHILVKSRKDAESLITALNGGADFKALAKKESTGPSASSGGDLGWTSKGSFVPTFEDALYALKDGETTQKPVKTQFGWHVIKREKSRVKEIPSFESMKPQLRQSVINRVLDKVVSDVMKDAKIVEHKIDK